MTFSETIKDWMTKTNRTSKIAAADLGVPLRTLNDWLEEGGHQPHRDRQEVVKQKISASIKPSTDNEGHTVLVE
jgi:hypothetical protein